MKNIGPKRRNLNRNAAIRIATISTIALIGMMSLGVVGPLPPGLDGATLCFPFIGPVQRFDPALSDTTWLRVVVHENAHRDDCERLGAVRHYLSIVTTTGRLEAETRAGCAEARMQIAIGRHPYLEHERLVDELHYGHPWLRNRPEEELRAVIRRTCPDVAEAGVDPPWRRKPAATATTSQ